ncbi:hypothetical protein JTE90_016806 [Oedothorax gibbosus]|uniref:Uncharacterized protein n=1 Tax=Oedothorax gibbosus TaxID=931172 RepID=A0AAV6VX31_9ARAC|nr:hypothetical protein JTE90_016806 [Oedothorax gibbosus]
MDDVVDLRIERVLSERTEEAEYLRQESLISYDTSLPGLHLGNDLQDLSGRTVLEDNFQTIPIISLPGQDITITVV